MYDAQRQVKEGKELRPARQREVACSVRRYRIPMASIRIVLFEVNPPCYVIRDSTPASALRKSYSPDLPSSYGRGHFTSKPSFFHRYLAIMVTTLRCPQQNPFTHPYQFKHTNKLSTKKTPRSSSSPSISPNPVLSRYSPPLFFVSLLSSPAIPPPKSKL